jgi:hypothetical protein
VVQLCDVAYVLMLKRLERWAMVSYLSAVIALSQGAQVDLPDPGDARAAFDAWLVSPLGPVEVEPVDRERAEIVAALGLN